MSVTRNPDKKPVRKRFLNTVPAEIIQNKILLIQGHKVILDRDLAELYGVTTGNLNKAVRRNQGRFRQDFMFELTRQEADSLRFQFGSLKRGEVLGIGSMRPSIY